MPIYPDNGHVCGRDYKDIFIFLRICPPPASYTLRHQILWHNETIISSCKSPKRGRIVGRSTKA